MPRITPNKPIKLKMSFPVILGRSQLLGSMDDLICPCCSGSDIWLFKDIDIKDLRSYCNGCGFEIRYKDANVIRSVWERLNA